MVVVVVVSLRAAASINCGCVRVKCRMKSFSSKSLSVLVVVVSLAAFVSAQQQPRPTTRGIAEVCLQEVPENPTPEQIAAATAQFEAEAQKYFNRFLPCAFRPPNNPSYQCCSNIDNLFGPFPGAEFHNCLCLPSVFEGFVETAGARFDVETLFNRCAVKFPVGFRTLFNSEATRQSRAQQRCTPDLVNVPEDFVAPELVSLEEIGLTEQDADAIADIIEEEIRKLAPQPEPDSSSD